MKCEHAAEFVSALCDGERIPREAAEHVGQCETCRARLKEYAEMGAELRRVASLESREEARAHAWERRTTPGWWSKGWENMLIPRFAFALLLVAIAVLGTGLVMVRARAHTEGTVLLLTAKSEEGGIERCALSTEDKRDADCSSMVESKLGELDTSFRVIGRDGDRIVLGVRVRFTARGPGPHTSTWKPEDQPETQYRLEPGEKLEIEVPGSGTMVVTGQLLDHMPSMRQSPDFQFDPQPGELRVISPVLLRGKEVEFDFDGSDASTDNKSQAVWISMPGEGRYVFATSPFEGAVEGRVKMNRVSFEMNGEAYSFLMAAPPATGEHIWIRHDANFEEPGDGKGGATGTEDLSDLLGKAPAKN